MPASASIATRAPVVRASCSRVARPFVAADDAVDAGADFLRELERAHEVHAHVLRAVPTADREHEHTVALAQARAAQPLDEAGVPAFVVDARGELADVVGRRVRLEPAQ